jgi:hypothetical protein
VNESPWIKTSQLFLLNYVETRRPEQPRRRLAKGSRTGLLGQCKRLILLPIYIPSVNRAG